MGVLGKRQSGSSRQKANDTRKGQSGSSKDTVEVLGKGPNRSSKQKDRVGALGKRHSGNGRQRVLGIQNGPLSKACLVPVRFSLLHPTERAS